MLDKHVKIDNEHYAITLIDSGVSKHSDPYTWGGHAAILVEGLKGDKYFMKIAHLRKGSKKGAGIVLLDDIKDPIQLRKVSNSETWRRDRSKAQFMLEQVQKEIDDQDSGKSEVHFSLFGKNSIFNVLTQIGSPRISLKDNCFSWTRDKLFFADIELPENLSEEIWVALPRTQIAKLQHKAENEISHK